MSITDHALAAASALVLAVLIWAVALSLGAPARRPALADDASALEDEAHCATLGFGPGDARHGACRERLSQVRREGRRRAVQPGLL